MIYVVIGIVAIVVFFLFVYLKKPKRVLLEGNDKWVNVTLMDVKPISHDTKVFVFEFPEKDLELGLPIGAHVLFRAQIPTKANPNGEMVVRKYTPTSPHDEKGKLECPIKIYHRNVHPAFPEGGLMTQYLDSLQIGDTLQISGPKGRLRYLGHGTFKIGDGEQFTVKNMALVCGGSGITPCFQFIQYIIEVEKGEIGLYLVYANKTEEDILLRQRIEKFVETGKLKVFYTLDHPPKDWNYGIGFITAEMLKKHLPPPESSIACCCGPPMMTDMVYKHFVSLGFQHKHRF